MSDPTAPAVPAPAAPAPAAPAAPAPSPAVPPAVPALTAAPAPEPAAPAPEPAPQAKFDPTGDPLLDTALDYVAKLGIASTDPAIAAAQDGDFGPLEAKLLALGDKAKDHPRFLALAKRAYEDATKKTEAHNAEVTKVVHTAVGGEAQWLAIQTWASAQATDAEKAQINAAFAAGGLQAKAAAEYLAKAFAKAGRPGIPKTAATKPEAAAAPTGAEPLTAREYARKVDELSRANRGGDVTHLPEYQALRARRLAGKAAGV